MELGQSYRVLGVPSDADLQDVKNAFKRLALEYHPDRNKSPEAAKMFATVIEAYNEIMNSQGVAASERLHADDVVGAQYGRLSFSIMTEEQEVFHHAYAPMFEGEIRSHFNPKTISGTFCKVGKRWFQIDSQTHSSFAFLGLHSSNRENLIEWYKGSDGTDKWKPVRWEEFWSYVRRYGSRTLQQQRRYDQ